MIKLFFGLPGCGKTTALAYFALKNSSGKRYRHIYGNVPLAGCPNYVHIENEDIGVYDLSDSLILIDEGTLFADNRDYKNFPKHQIQFFLLHRHYNCDIYIFTQQWDGVDKKIRVITDRVYYLYKPFFTGFFRTKIWRIPYGLIIPDRKDTHSAKYGDIVQGYFKPPLIARFASPSIFRPKYYKYFNSWDRPKLPPLPDRSPSQGCGQED